MIHIPAKPWDSVEYKSRSYKVWDLYLRTFYGPADVYPSFSRGVPRYDIESATIYNVRNGEEYVINGEEYKPIPGYPGYYISRRGVVFSSKRYQFQRHRIDKDGYHKVDLYKCDVPDGEVPSTKIVAVHRAIYNAWISHMDDEHVVNHRDEIRWHNLPENFDEMTSVENVRASSRYLSDDDVHHICQMMEKNVPFAQIAKEFGYSKEKDLAAYYRFGRKLAVFMHPRSVRIKADIVKQYDLSNYDFGEPMVSYHTYLKKYATPRTYQPAITEDIKHKMLSDYKRGYTFRDIALKYGFSIVAASRAVRELRRRIETHIS